MAFDHNRGANLGRMPNGQGEPLLGALTQTLVNSPVIRSIIPARIRHADKNDVILVRNDSIEINEVIKVFEANRLRDAYLTHITRKADFDSSIRAARVFGKPRIYEKRDKALEGLDVIKDEYDTLPVQRSVYRPEIPPQILAITLESSKIVFLCAFYDKHGHVQWLSNYRVLPDYAQTYSKQLGEHIAVDPKSRAMAVAANEGSFVLYSLKNMDKLKGEVETDEGLKSTGFDPIADERFFNVDGVIIRMEFLHPSKTNDMDEVILLVIAATKQKTKLHCYIWDSSTDLRQASQLGSGQRVPENEQLPLLLIPLTMSTAFMLVFQNFITVYTGILTGPATPHIHILRHLEDPEEPGSSRSLPLFTQWARALRHDDHRSVQDNIYLCREDGVVRFLEISENIKGMIESGHDAGELRVNIDTAFASLDLGALAPDLLAVGGNMSSGGLWFFEPRKGARPTSSIANWTPTIDITTTEAGYPPTYVPPLETEIKGPPKQPTRIFASTGRGPSHGEITEMRYGIQGEITGEDYNHLGSHVNQIWALPDSLENNIHMLTTSPTGTAYQLVNSDVDQELGIISDTRTIAAGLTDDGCIVQITTTTIVVTSTSNKRRHFELNLQDESVTSASVLTSDSYGCVILSTTRQKSGDFLQCYLVLVDSKNIALQQLGVPVELSARPSCSSLQEIKGSILALVGLSTGSLQIFGADIANETSFQLILEHKFEDDFAICDSIATVSDGFSSWLVCGLRNGVCQTFSLDSTGELHLSALEKLVLGSTSVNVQADQSQKNIAIMTCEEHFCALEYSSEFPKVAIIRNILLTNNAKPGYRHKDIVAFTQAPLWERNGVPGFAAGQWFVIEGESFYLVRIYAGSGSDMVPRRLHLDGTPSRVAYSEKLDKLIVLYTRIVIKRAYAPGRPGQRAVEPTFAFFDTDEELLRSDPTDPNNGELRVMLPNGESRRANVLAVQERKQGEKFLGMTEWLPTDGNNIYHMLVAFTMIVYVDSRAPTGRLLFFSLSKNTNGEVGMTLKKTKVLKAPVFAAIPYGQSSLIYSCGNDICLHTLNLASTPRDWLEPITLRLQSRGVYLSVSGNKLHVTTAADSVSEIRIAEDLGSMSLQYSDESARDGICHLHIPEHNLVIVSSKDGTITGLKQPIRPDISNSMTTVFAADFPGSITRLRRVSKPSWHTSGNKYGGSAIVASTADGSFYQIEIVSEASWRLLRFITNMARRHPRICPYRERVSAMMQTQHSSHIEPSSTNKRIMHLDGDILHRLLDRGAGELLRDMVQREPSKRDPFGRDFDTAAAREHRFWELVADAGIQESTFQAVVGWIRQMLRSAL